METAARIILMILFIVLVAIGIVIFGVFGILPLKRLSQSLNQPQATSTAQGYQPSQLSATSVPPVPSVQAPSSYQPNTIGAVYFNIKADGGKYSPDSISTKIGDVLTIYFTAIDNDYNITFPDFGVSKTTLKGEAAFIQFQVTSVGTYRFFCKDVCKMPVEGSLKVTD